MQQICEHLALSKAFEQSSNLQLSSTAATDGQPLEYGTWFPNGMSCCPLVEALTHWGLVIQICFSELDHYIVSKNGVLPIRRQATFWTNVNLLLTGPFEINFSDIWIKNIGFHTKNCTWICRQRNIGHFVRASVCWWESKSPGLTTTVRYFDRDIVAR